MSFPFLYILNSFQSSLSVYCQVCLPVKETAEIETGMAEKSSWDQANIRQKLGLVWRNRKKISQIIKDYFYLPFFLLIILWLGPSSVARIQQCCSGPSLLSINVYHSQLLFIYWYKWLSCFLFLPHSYLLDIDLPLYPRLFTCTRHCFCPLYALNL